jgi:hypothetical protein
VEPRAEVRRDRTEEEEDETRRRERTPGGRGGSGRIEILRSWVLSWGWESLKNRSNLLKFNGLSNSHEFDKKSTKFDFKI